MSCADFVRRSLARVAPLSGYEVSRASQALESLYHARDLLPHVPLRARLDAYNELTDEGYEPRRMFRALLTGGAS